MARRLETAHQLVMDAQWNKIGRTEFVKVVSAIFAEINQAHPFREGNARTSKVFMDQLAERTDFALVWGNVNPSVWNQASVFSGPDRGAWQTHPEELHEVFEAITTQRA